MRRAAAQGAVLGVCLVVFFNASVVVVALIAALVCMVGAIA